MSEKASKRNYKKGIARAAIVLVGLFTLYSSLVITPFGHRSVIWSVGGVSFEERESGLSFVVPFVQRAHLVDVREQRYAAVDEEGKARAFVQSSDLQEITVRASLIYRVSPTQAAEVYDEVGPEYQLRVVEPIFFDAIKEAGGQVKAEAFASSLSSIAADVASIVTPQLAERGIDVLSVALEDAVFDPDFVQSIKEKVIADQEAAEQQRLVAAEVAKKEQVELQAQAQQARANELGLSPEQYLELLWLERWDGALPATLMGADADVLVNVP